MTETKNPKIGVVIYTYNRTDDAFINMEIIRNVWSKSEILKDVKIVHAYNGEREWWPEKYLEDELLYLDNPGHFAGAELLINEGVKALQEKHPDTDYCIVLASDTWLVKPEYIEKVILAMQKEEKYIAACAWGSRKHTNIWERGMSLDLLVLDLKWVTKSGMFPLRYGEFTEKYRELFLYNDKTIYLENILAIRYKEAILRMIKLESDNLFKQAAEGHLYRMKEREPVHINGNENLLFKNKNWKRIMYWPKMGLITHHDPAPKQIALKRWNLNLGEHGNKFLNANDLSYYNRGLIRHLYKKGSKESGYGD